MKEYLRKFAKEKRSDLHAEKLSPLIILNLTNMPEYKQAKNIMCYYSIGSEVNTHNLTEDKTKNWFLPKMTSENGLVVCPFEGESSLNRVKYGIMEPNSKEIKDMTVLDMIIIPCLCADKNGYRIGYGKGYYDRFLKDIPPKCPKVILAYSELLFDSVHPDKHDIKCDFVVTENQVYKI